jgi:DNA adenine methylase
MTNTTIKPVLKYPGAKWSIAKWITSFFPKHTHYLEPYCGSAAVFFNKTPAEHEVLGDTNQSITNLFHVLRTHGQELAELIALSPWCESDYEAIAKHYDDSGDAIEDARRFLVRSWQAHGGTIYQVSGWKHNGLTGKVYPAHLWRKLPGRLLAVVDRLKDAEIRNRPALELIAYYNDPECLIYADPPYVLSTRDRKYYKYEMTDDEHVALLNALDVHRGPVILSAYSHPLYTNRLSHWHKVTTPSVTEHGNRRTEVLWLNARAAGERQLPLFTNESEGVA